MKTVVLKDMYKEMEEIKNPPVSSKMSLFNIDDMFREMLNRGIEEVEVDAGEMMDIVRFVISNIYPTSKLFNIIDGKIVLTSELENETLRMLKEGTIDKFFGIKLKKN